MHRPPLACALHCNKQVACQTLGAGGGGPRTQPGCAASSLWETGCGSQRRVASTPPPQST